MLLVYADAHARQASQVINNMLVYTKIQAGKFSAPLEPFSVWSALNESITLALHLCHDKTLTLRLAASEAELPSRSMGSSAHLVQLLVNLLTNAIKYTDTGEVVLCARMVHSVGGERTASSHAARIEFAVEDTGCGVSAERQAQVFEAWEQGCQPGTGLGLALCNRLVESMGGLLQLESPVASTGLGSRFSFVIELDDAHLDDPYARRRARPHARPRSPVKSSPAHAGDVTSDEGDYQSAEEDLGRESYSMPKPPAAPSAATPSSKREVLGGRDLKDGKALVRKSPKGKAAIVPEIGASKCSSKGYLHRFFHELLSTSRNIP